MKNIYGNAFTIALETSYSLYIDIQGVRGSANSIPRTLVRCGCSDNKENLFRCIKSRECYVKLVSLTLSWPCDGDKGSYICSVLSPCCFSYIREMGYGRSNEAIGEESFCNVFPMYVEYTKIAYNQTLGKLEETKNKKILAESVQSLCQKMTMGP